MSGSASRETFDEPSEARLYPGAWAPAEFQGLDEGILVRNWVICGPFGGPGAERFSWNPNGRSIVHVMDNSVCVTDLNTGNTRRLTPRNSEATAPRSEACVVSPDGKKVAFVRMVSTGSERGFNQIFVVSIQ